MMKLVDLTLPIHEGMLTFDRPWHVRVQMEQLAEIGIQGRATRRLVLGSHTGTHVDAPSHFLAGGADVEALPLHALVGRATVLDFRNLAPLTPVTPEMLATALDGRMPQRLLLQYGWDRLWGQPAYYRGHPFLSEAAAHWLADMGLSLLGLDTAMADNPEPPVGAPDSPVHKILLRAGIVLLEYLCNLGQLSASEVTLLALPLKLRGSDGAPARCVAYDGLADFSVESPYN